MSRILCCAATILFSFAAGCGSTQVAPPAAPEPTPTVAEAPEATPAVTDDLAPTAVVAPAETPAQKHVGDYVVYRFSGSFRKAPLTLTQKIYAREAGTLAVDFTLDDGGKKETLRVRMDEQSTEKQVISVARLEKESEIPSTIAAYEAMLQKTVLSADRNDDFLGAEKVSVDIGGKSVACTKSAFQVRVGRKNAVLHILASEEFAWGDLGGDITTSDGKVLYRAEILDAGSSKQANTVATTDELDRAS